MTERRFNDAEVAEIFERAAKGHALGGMHAASGMTISQLQSIGREVGIPPGEIASAALSLSPSKANPTQRFLGMTTGVDHTVQLPRKLTDDEWERFVAMVRETFNAKGKVTTEGSLKSWSNGKLQVLLEPTDAGHRVRFTTVKGIVPYTVGGGLLVTTGAMIGEITAVLTGVAHDIGLVASFGVGGAIGLATAVVTALRLPGWVRTRKAQMEELGARVHAMALTPPDLE